MLRAKGVTVKFIYTVQDVPLHGKRRVTACEIREGEEKGKFSDKKLVASGEAVCVPPDPFVKATGRKIAFERALWQAQYDRPTRAELWKAYWAMIHKHGA